MAGMTELRAVVALGRIAHDSLLTTVGARKAANPFGHGRVHEQVGGFRLFDSFHCSRYNTNTRVLTPEMFRSVLENARDFALGT